MGNASFDAFNDQEQRCGKEKKSEPNCSSLKDNVLEDLIAKDTFQEETQFCNPENGSMAGVSGRSSFQIDSNIDDTDIDVSEDDRLIIIADDSMVSCLILIVYSVMSKLVQKCRNCGLNG